MTAHDRDAGPPCPPEPDADAVSLREALIALDNLTRLSGHLWHHVDVPLRHLDVCFSP